MDLIGTNVFFFLSFFPLPLCRPGLFLIRCLEVETLATSLEHHCWLQTVVPCSMYPFPAIKFYLSLGLLTSGTLLSGLFRFYLHL